jgi:transketolase
MVAEARPDRFLQMGFAAPSMVGVAAGLATLGLIPWISSLAFHFAERDLIQIRALVAQPRLNVKLAAHCGGVLSPRVQDQLTIQDLAIMRSLPNMVTLVPADEMETRLAMLAAHAYDGPVYLRLARDPGVSLFDKDYVFQIGKAVVLRKGRDIALISTGPQTARCLQAAIILDTVGISTRVLHVSTIKPLDEEAIVDAARTTGAVVIAEEHTILGGLGSAVAELLGEIHPVRLRRVGLRDVYTESAPSEKRLAKYGLSPAHIAEAAQELLHSPAFPSL